MYLRIAKHLSYYNGNCIRVRRSSDGAELDVGFTVLGALDVASLLVFAGSGSCYIITLYDQTGNGRNAVQLSSSSQPRIVNAGVLETGPNGKPQIVFSGAQHLDILNSTSFSRNQANLTFAAVVRNTSTGVILYFPVNSTAGSVRGYMGFSPSVTTPLIQTRSNDVVAPTSVTGANTISGNWNRIIGRGRYSSGAVDMSVNGTIATNATMTPIQNTPNSNQFANIRIGAATFGGAFLTGNLSTFLLAQNAIDMIALNTTMLEVMP